MKKGISLIVLVITIIVMIIIAGAIILALNSSNVTNKAKWSQISADRANLQSEYAVILANTLAGEKIGNDQTVDADGKVTSTERYDGLTLEDIKATDEYTAWEAKVPTTNSRFDITGDDEKTPAQNTNPAGVKVVMEITADEATAFGLTTKDVQVGEGESATTKTVVVGYDWVTVKAASAQ